MARSHVGDSRFVLATFPEERVTDFYHLCSCGFYVSSVSDGLIVDGDHPDVSVCDLTIEHVGSRSEVVGPAFPGFSEEFVSFLV